MSGLLPTYAPIRAAENQVCDGLRGLRPPFCAAQKAKTNQSPFNKCLEWKMYQGENHSRHIKKFEESTGKLRFLDHDEESRLLAVASEPLRTIILTGIHAGLRIKAPALTLRFRSVRTIFTTACRNAKLRGVTLHTLRLVMAGVDLRTVQELGGWKDLRMVMRYAHLSPAHKADAVEKIADHSTTLFTTDSDLAVHH